MVTSSIKRSNDAGKRILFRTLWEGGPKDLKGDVGGGIFCKDARGGILSLPFFLMIILFLLLLFCTLYNDWSQMFLDKEDTSWRKRADI